MRLKGDFETSNTMVEFRLSLDNVILPDLNGLLVLVYVSFFVFWKLGFQNAILVAGFNDLFFDMGWQLNFFEVRSIQSLWAYGQSSVFHFQIYIAFFDAR